MTSTLGALGYVAYGVETVEGTAHARTRIIPVSSFDMDSPNDIIVPDQIRRARERFVGMDGVINPSGSMEMELVPNDITPLLQSAWTASVVTAANSGDPAAWDHTFTPADVNPTLTAEADFATVLQTLFTGVRVDTLSLKASFGELITASFGLEGLGFQKSTDGVLTGVNYADVMPFSFSGTQVTIGGSQVGYVTEFNFDTGNNIQKNGGLRKNRAQRRSITGFRDVDLGLTVDFDTSSEAEVERWINSSEFGVVLEFEGSELITGATTAKPKLVITVPRVKFKKALPKLSAGDFLSSEIETQILRPRDRSPIFTAVLTNGENAAASGAI